MDEKQTSIIQNNVSTISQGTSSSNIKQYFDMMITNQILSTMATKFDKDDKYGLKLLFKMILMSSMDDIRKFLSIYCFSLIEKIKQFFQYVYNKRMNTEQINIPQITNYESNELYRLSEQSIYIQLKPTDEFIRSMFRYIDDNSSTCSFKKLNRIDITIQNVEQKLVKETFDDIKFKYKNADIKINNRLEIDTTINKNNKIINTNCIKQIYISKMSDLIDDEEMRIAFDGVYKQYESYAKGRIGNLKFEKMLNYIMISKTNDQTYWVMDKCPVAIAISSLKNNFKGISDVEFYNSILLMYGIYNLRDDLMFVRNPTTQTSTTIIFGILIDNLPQSTDKNYRSSLTPAQDIVGTYLNTIKSQLTVSNIKTLKMQQNNPFLNSDNHIQFKVSSNDLTESELHELFNEFINCFNMLPDKSKIYKIKMNHLRLLYEKTINETPNPSYAEYIEKKELLVKMDDKTDHSNKLIVINELLANIPEKTIKTEVIVKKIDCKVINETYKHFDTLYLRQNDLFELKESLDIFKDRKELMETLGLQHKLGILLHGLPGTGKTSTIYAVASYLQKDLYYVNLNELKTNKDLQMMFDHVNKNCVNAGILIFEDIDAMTKVVHKRVYSDERSSNVVEIMDSGNNALTLEYFLNVLQGSLTQDGTVFIVTTNHIECIDEAFVRIGRFDVKIEMKRCDYHQINMIYNNFYKRNVPSELLNRISEDKWTPADIIFHIKNFMFGNYSDEIILDKFLE